MALAKVKNRETILKGIIGLLIATNILSFGQYIVKCNELSDERIAHQKTIEKAKKVPHEIITSHTYKKPKIQGNPPNKTETHNTLSTSNIIA